MDYTENLRKKLTICRILAILQNSDYTKFCLLKKSRKFTKFFYLTKNFGHLFGRCVKTFGYLRY